MPTTPTNALRAFQQESNAIFMPYGDAQNGVEVVETFDSYEAEYAAIRKSVVIFDMPQRGLVDVRGADRLAFLHSMITNDTESLGPDQAQRAFLLAKTGRIAADLVVCRFGDEACRIDLDVFDAAPLVEVLDRYVFTEDVSLEDVSAQFHHLALHGPAAARLVERISGQSVAGLESYRCAQVVIADCPCPLYRRDETGSSGLHLLVATGHVRRVYESLADAVGGLVPQVQGGVRRDFEGRGTGWLAYNTARIEAGTPVYHIDFGPDSLPHETGPGLMGESISFTKGCYLGQEIVARMENLGHPKRVLAGILFADEYLPIAGSQVFSSDEEGSNIGVVTSSTVSPLLGGRAVAFAMFKWGRHRPDTRVKVAAEGRMLTGTVQDMRFLS